MLETCQTCGIQILPSQIESGECFRCIAKRFKEERDEARKETLHWRANHDNQAKIKAAILNRPDLGDRARKVQALMEENRRLKEALIKLLPQHLMACCQQNESGNWVINQSGLVKITKESCKCSAETKTFRELIDHNVSGKGFDK
jgi:hypothetical protein